MLEIIVGHIADISSVVPGLRVGDDQGVALVFVGSGRQTPEGFIEMTLSVPAWWGDKGGISALSVSVSLPLILSATPDLSLTPHNYFQFVSLHTYHSQLLGDGVPRTLQGNTTVVYWAM